ncbi:MAG: hypothetical protein Q9227_000890 [Pyrenula ochraceoflavens]
MLTAGPTNYNLKTCATVNETAPSFVGCSGSQSGAASSFITSASGSSKASANPLVATVTGAVESQLTSFIGSTPVTATFAGQSILTGSCTIPYFAMVTDSMGMITEFPEIGCSHDMEGCCPYDSHQNAVLTKCPADYTTTAGGCCPSGWQIYFGQLGGQTPCYTMPATTHVPASSPAQGVAVITEHVFTRKYSLAAGAASGADSGISTGAKAGIAVGAAGGAAALAALAIFTIMRRRKAKAKIDREKDEPHPYREEDRNPETPASAPAHELPSPYAGISPPSTTAPWRFFPAVKQIVQELPGSTYIHEHHPAYGEARPPSEMPASEAGETAPTASNPGASEIASDSGHTMSSPSVMSPLDSPRRG